MFACHNAWSGGDDVKNQKLAIGLGALVLLALFWWLTAYKYDHVSFVQGISTISRTHRLTGKTELLSLQRGWVPSQDFDFRADILYSHMSR
jgi:hypothetical protein